MVYRVIAIVTAVLLAAAVAAGLLARTVAGPAALGLGTWIAAFVAIDGLLLYAMLERRASLFGRIVWRGRADQPRVALSFDDGPNEPYTSQLLEVLREHGVRATFFMLGANVDRHPDTVRRLIADGHEVGNHTYDHGVLPLRSPGAIRQAIRHGADAIERAAGVRPRLFRAPHGFRNPWVDRIARDEGCEPVAWTRGVFDTARPGAEVIRARVSDGLSNGCILLLHDGRGTAPHADAGQLVDALPGIITDARARGFRFATVGELMADLRRS
jgi:peptidoglycan/xylan/chitin deacetylase (PgdA/CDA1 family)